MVSNGPDGSQLVDVGGYRLAVSVAGSGCPPVVFVSGVTGDVSEWEGVQAAVQVATTRVAYARPALGGSDPLPPSLASVPRAPSWAAAQLRELLHHVGVPTPRVLTGHSIGGLIVEAYTAQWPDETAGLVLVDPSDPRANLTFGQPPFVSADNEAGGIRFAMRACQEERLHFPPPPAVPTVVVSSAAGRWLRVDDPAEVSPLTLAEVDDLWQQFQREWAERMNADQVIAHSAGHCVHVEAPALVACVVDAVVTAVRDGGSTHLDPSGLGEAGGRLVGR